MGLDSTFYAKHPDGLEDLSFNIRRFDLILDWSLAVAGKRDIDDINGVEIPVTASDILCLMEMYMADSVETRWGLFKELAELMDALKEKNVTGIYVMSDW